MWCTKRVGAYSGYSWIILATSISSGVMRCDLSNVCVCVPKNAFLNLSLSHSHVCCVFCADPYTDRRFMTHYKWLSQLDPVSLRHHAFIEGLITDIQFKELAALGSQTDHNAKLISYIKPFGMESFLALLKTLREAFPLAKARICKLEELCYPQGKKVLFDGQEFAGLRRT